MEHPALTKKRWSLWGVRLERKMAVENLRLLIGMSVSVHWFGNGSHHFRPTSGDTSNRFPTFWGTQSWQLVLKILANLGQRAGPTAWLISWSSLFRWCFGASANPHIATIRQITSEKYSDKCVEWLSVTILFLLPILMVKTPDFNLHLGGEIPHALPGARQLWNRSSARPWAKPSMPGARRWESIKKLCYRWVTMVMSLIVSISYLSSGAVSSGAIQAIQGYYIIPSPWDAKVRARSRSRLVHAGETSPRSVSLFQFGLFSPIRGTW